MSGWSFCVNPKFQPFNVRNNVFRRIHLDLMVILNVLTRVFINVARFDCFAARFSIILCTLCSTRVQSHKYLMGLRSCFCVVYWKKRPLIAPSCLINKECFAFAWPDVRWIRNLFNHEPSHFYVENNENREYRFHERPLGTQDTQPRQYNQSFLHDAYGREACIDTKIRTHSRSS